MATTTVASSAHAAQRRAPATKIPLLEGLRALGVTLGPALLLDLYAGVSTIALVRGMRARRPLKGPARSGWAQGAVFAPVPGARERIARPEHQR